MASSRNNVAKSFGYQPRFYRIVGILMMACALCTGYPLLYAQPPYQPKETPTIVTAIYPTADKIPENLLRFYIRFSKAMQRGDVYDNIYLLNSEGQRVEAPFLRIGQELWDADMQVLTMMLDPGRIKQGVAPHTEAGSPLTQSYSYTLVVNATLTDLHGRNLLQTYRKTFKVTSPDRASPNPTHWRISAPGVGSREDLKIQLDDSVDPMVAQRTIRLEDTQGKRLSGTMKLLERENTISFVPEAEWTAGEHRVAIHPSLEDYAGNRLHTLFDMEQGTIASVLENTHPVITYRFFNTVKRSP